MSRLPAILLCVLCGCAAAPVPSPLPGPVAMQSAAPMIIAHSASEVASPVSELRIQPGTMAAAGWWLPGWFDAAGFHETDATIPRGAQVLLLTAPASRRLATVECSEDLQHWRPCLTYVAGPVPVAVKSNAMYFRFL